VTAHRRRAPSLLAQPAYLAGQVSKYGRRELDRALGERGLALIQHAVLAALDDLGPLSQQQLADSLDFDKSHLVAQLDRLEERGLVKRMPDQSDRRRKQLLLTAAGKALVGELEPLARRSQKDLLDSLSADERRTLISLLRRVVDANDAAR
jgi:MarR family transcriptional regulator, lower aerobic nicotinate degradation pathway regulator